MGTMPNNAVAENFLAFAVNRLRHSAQDIDRCLDRLTPAQIWERGGDYENSIANLLLHLEGNTRQWILHGIDGQPDVRQRDDEFALQPTAAVREVRARFAATLEEACEVISALSGDSPERLLTVIDPQPNSTSRHRTILETVFQVVGHIQLHAGQIILLTKQFVAEDLDLSMPRKRT